MSQNAALQNGKRLTFARPEEMALSIRATALVFEDPASTALLSDIELIAAREVTAMIIGETAPTLRRRSRSPSSRRSIPAPSGTRCMRRSDSTCRRRRGTA